MSSYLGEKLSCLGKKPSYLGRFQTYVFRGNSNFRVIWMPVFVGFIGGSDKAAPFDLPEEPGDLEGNLWFLMSWRVDFVGLFYALFAPLGSVAMRF